MQILDIVTQLASMITAGGVISVAMKKWLIIPLEKKIDDINMNQCRNYLVDSMADIQNGVKKNPTQIVRMYEIHDCYIKNGGNSYVHDEWEKLKKEGKI